MSAIFWTSSVSNFSLRSLSRARGTISRSAKSLAVSRIRRCSSVSSKSIGTGSGRVSGRRIERRLAQVDEFTVFTFGALGALFLVFWAIGKWYPGSGAEQVDWRPTRSPELEIELELDDVDQMIEAQNVRRRASGRPEITEEQIRTDVEH